MAVRISDEDQSCSPVTRLKTPEQDSEKVMAKRMTRRGDSP